MKFVMNKIMSIDKDAEKYRKGIEEMLKQKQNELENIIKDMWALFQEESTDIKNDMTNEKIIQAKYMVEDIIKEKEERLNEINTKYQSNKSVIVEAIFNRIIKSF